MNTQLKESNKITGILLLTGAVALFIPYTMLVINFNYPDILRKDTATILTSFHQGGSRLIWTWFAFAITGVPLIPAYIRLGQSLQSKANIARLATTLGVIGLIVQMIGLLRWTFVIPVLADTFVNATDEPTKTAVIIAFKTVHQFAGVLLGEHMGQLFTISWTVMIAIAMQRAKFVPGWVVIFGYIASAIYVLAQAELFATVMPSFPVWDMAGFLGSTLWLIWLITVGIYCLRSQNAN